MQIDYSVRKHHDAAPFSEGARSAAMCAGARGPRLLSVTGFPSACPRLGRVHGLPTGHMVWPRRFPRTADDPVRGFGLWLADGADHPEMHAAEAVLPRSWRRTEPGGRISRAAASLAATFVTPAWLGRAPVEAAMVSIPASRRAGGDETGRANNRRSAWCAAAGRVGSSPAEEDRTPRGSMPPLVTGNRVQRARRASERRNCCERPARAPGDAEAQALLGKTWNSRSKTRPAPGHSAISTADWSLAFFPASPRDRLCPLARHRGAGWPGRRRPGAVERERERVPLRGGERG
jgi:hypothetical protein